MYTPGTVCGSPTSTTFHLFKSRCTVIDSTERTWVFYVPFAWDTIVELLGYGIKDQRTMIRTSVTVGLMDPPPINFICNYEYGP